MSESNKKSELLAATNAALKLIDREREREVIERRFGLNGKKDTLEAVGEIMSITRERVRQIEKATLIRIKIKLRAGQADIESAETEIIKTLHEMGRVARVEDLAEKLTGESDLKTVGALNLIANLSNKLIATSENDKYYAGVALSDDDDDKTIKAAVDEIVAKLRSKKTAVTVDELFDLVKDSKIANYEHPSEVVALASLSKQLATLDGLWGLDKNPEVNPKKIRDKIYFVLKNNNKRPMHFSEIAFAIKSQNFTRNDITDQAVHNELIKDDRFVLIGRGIYALSEWGFEAGSVSDVIAKVLRENGAPMKRDDIIAKVLEQRQVRTATILLNLQNKPEFRRVAKGEYTLAA